MFIGLEKVKVETGLIALAYNNNKYTLKMAQ